MSTWYIPFLYVSVHQQFFQSVLSKNLLPSLNPLEASTSHEEKMDCIGFINTIETPQGSSLLGCTSFFFANPVDVMYSRKRTQLAYMRLLISVFLAFRSTTSSSYKYVAPL